ncbi:hypothetical protein MBLNU457_g2633t1 [Dothideomycetes sp. NU457]
MEPSTTTTLQSTGPLTALGMPVNTEKLILNLETYLRKKEMNVIWDLHLRNRPGRNNLVAKLPTEIIYMVEDELHKDARRVSYDGFEVDFACFEDRCEPRVEFNDEEEISDITFGRPRSSGVAHEWRRYSGQVCIARLLRLQEWQNRNADPFGAHPWQSFLYTGCHICYTILFRGMTQEGLVAQALHIHRNHLHQPLRLKMWRWLEDVFRNDIGKILREDFGLTVRTVQFDLTNVTAGELALMWYTPAKYHAPPEHMAICYLTRPWGVTMSDRELRRRIANAMETLKLEPFFNLPPSAVRTSIDIWAD